MAILRTMLARHGERVVDGTWLDIGCGSGGIASALAPAVHRIIGVDPEPWPSWASMMAAQPTLSFVAAGFDGELLPLPEASVDAVICNQVYEHVAHPAALIRNIRRVLRPGGVCYFAGPNLLWPIEPHMFWPFVHWLPRNTAHRVMAMLGARSPKDLDAYSVHVWRLRRWFEEAGLAWADAVPMRIAAEVGLRGHTRLATLIARVPAGLWTPFRACWPGFVFYLDAPEARAAGSR